MFNYPLNTSTFHIHQGESCLRHEDLIEKIEKEGSSIAVVFMSGVQYFTGQFFRIQEITEAAHAKVICNLANRAVSLFMFSHLEFD